MKDKKVNHRGILCIETDDDNRHHIVFEPVNNTIWLNKSELAELLGVTLQKVNASLKKMVDKKLIDVDNQCKFDLFVSGNCILYNIQELRLELIIAMAFYVQTWQAKLIREWVVRRCIHPGICVNITMDAAFSKN